jgi:hypothetical protein
MKFIDWLLGRENPGQRASDDAQYERIQGGIRDLRRRTPDWQWPLRSDFPDSEDMDNKNYE